MSTNRLRKRLARWLVLHAAQSMPPERRAWAKAMLAEFEHIDGFGLRWAIGCVMTSYTERMQAIIRSHFMIPKWLLAIESSVFLFPVSAIWLVAALNLNVFVGDSATNIIVATTLMTIAPINLWFAFRFIAAQRPLHYRFHAISAALFVIYGIFQLLGIRHSYGGPSFAWFQFDWRLVLLFSILPATCCWHLSMFAKNAATRGQAV